MRNSAPQILAVSKRNDVITLEYSKNSWYIVDVDIKEDYSQVDLSVFLKDYNEAISLAQGDKIKAINSLKEKYVWLPSNEELIKQKNPY